jgi:sugar phosphate isomerase/epimerase
MKLGFVSAILGDLNFEQLVGVAAAEGYSCIEVCCWPSGKADRRYAGVTHIDVENLDGTRVAEIKALLHEKNIAISALGYYPNPLDPDENAASYCRSHIRKVIDASVLLGVNRINTFIGRDKNRSVDENFTRFAEVWKPLVGYARERSVSIGIENCPMIFTADEWPGGKNLATSPSVWRRMFSEIPDGNFGLNYDPSHLLWLQMDYLKPIYEFRNRIFHVHLKDAKVHRDKLDDIGIMGGPNEFHSPKLPGMGDINWGAFFSALNDIRYNGPVCVEVEDRAFEGSLEDRIRSLGISKRFLSQYL